MAPPAAAQAQPMIPKVVVSDQTEGPFRVGSQSFTFVKHVQSIQSKISGDESTVEWWELRDESGNALYRRQYPVALKTELWLTPRM